MLEYTLRLLGNSIRSLSSSKLDYLDESVISLRVWPTDLDSFGHMNNGRFFTIMDLGRNDILIRSGGVKVCLERRWTPLLGGGVIRYSRPLRPFRKYELRTKVLCWDEKWFYFRQRFVRNGKVYATAMVKGLLHGPEGKVPPGEIPTALGGSSTSPTMPDSIKRWAEAESSMLE